jgi:hypothetical protein
MAVKICWVIAVVTVALCGTLCAPAQAVGAAAIVTSDDGSSILFEDVVSATPPEGRGFGLLDASNGPSFSGEAFSDDSFSDAKPLPLGSRQWETLALTFSLANGATVAAGGSGDAEADIANARSGENDSSAAAGLSYGGLSPSQNDSTIDGLSAEQNYFSRPRGFGGRGSTMGGPVSGASFDESAVRAFRVMPGTYSAQFGGAASTVLAIASRAGANAWHGAAFALGRTSAMDAANPCSVVTRYNDGVVTNALVKPADASAQFGGHISLPFAQFLQRLHSGGASARERSLSAFVSWEQRLDDNPAESSPATTSFYALTATQTALLANRGVSAAAVNAALNYLDSLTGPVARFSNRGLGFARVDEERRHDHFVGTYTHNRFNLPAGSGFRSASNAVINQGVASVGDAFVRVDAGAAHWLHSFTPAMRSVLRLQYVRDLEFDQPRAPLAQEPAIAPGGYAPEVEIAPNGFSYGTPPNLGRTAYPDEKRLQAVAQVEGAFKRHLVMLGLDWSRIDDRIASFSNPDGRFLYDSGVINGRAGGLVDWITDYTFNVNAYPNGGCPSIHVAVHDFCFRTYTQNFGAAQTEFVTHTFAGFAEDAWQPRPGLSVTTGARWEYVLLPLPLRPNAVLDQALAQLSTPVTGATASFPEDRNNVGPRFGAAWAPRGGRMFVARLGYGWFYGRLAGTTVRSALADTAQATTQLSIKIRPTTETACPQGGAVPNQGFGYPCAFTATPPAAVVETSAAMLFASNFRLPAVQRATFSLERAIGRVAFVRASYAMAIATQLPGSVDINIAPATTMGTFVLQGGQGRPGLSSGESFVVPLYNARRLTQYGPVTALVSDANSTYHSGTVEAELREWKGVQVRGSYTFSRAIDYAPQISGTPQTDSQFDPFRNGFDKGLSTLDFPQRFAGDLVWHVSEKRGPRWIERTLNGWRVAAIATAGSGAPYSYEISGGTYLSGGDETLNGSGGATYLPTVGRNTLRLAVRGNADVRAEREFRIGRTAGHNARRDVRFSGFLESFNLLNERNLSRVETRAFLPGTAANGVTPLVFQDAATIAAEGLTTPAFGQPISSTSGVSRERQMEVGFRVDF